MTGTPYEPCGCGADCGYRHNDSEPCWGSVQAVDEITIGEDDWAWVHACEGHAGCIDGDPYVPDAGESAGEVAA